MPASEEFGDQQVNYDDDDEDDHDYYHQGDQDDGDGDDHDDVHDNANSFLVSRPTALEECIMTWVANNGGDNVSDRLVIVKVKMMWQTGTVIVMMKGKNLQVLYEVTASGVHTSCTVIAIFLRWWCCLKDLQMVLTLNFVKDGNQHNTQRSYWPRILQVLHELTGTDELYVDCEVVNRDDHCLVVESWWSLWSGQ